MSFLRDAVQDTTDAAAPERHGIRSLQCFDSLEIVEIAKILGVVTDSIYKEVGCRAISANRRLITIAFSLSHRDARDVSDYIRHAPHCLIAHECARDCRQRLRYVPWKRGNFRSCPGVVGRVAAGTARVDSDHIELLGFYLSRIGRRIGGWPGILGGYRVGRGKEEQRGGRDGKSEDCFDLKHLVGNRLGQSRQAKSGLP